MSALEQSVPEGYKQTEVGVIPIDWESPELGNFVQSLDAGVSVNSIDKPDAFSHGLHILKTSCVSNGYFFPREIKSIIPEDIIRAKTIVSKGSIIISRMNTPDLVGELGYIDKDYPNCFLPDRLWQMRFRANLATNTRWLAYILSFPAIAKKIKESATGTSNSMKNISKGSLLSVSFPAPSYEEQAAIANALSDVDALLTELEKLIAKKQAIKTATMQQLLTGKTRLPQFATYTEGEKQGQPKGTKPSELGEIPEDWDVVSLGDVITFKNGAAHEDCIDEYGNFVLVNSKFISTEGKVRKGTNECRQETIKNDLLMVMSDVPNGKAIAKCFLVDQDNLYTVNQRICILRPNEQINPTFLLKIVSRNPYYLAFDDGAKQTNLRREDVLNCPLVNPSFEEQTAIASILSDMDNEIQTLEQRLAKTRQIKQGMMQELLTGRTRLPFNKDKEA